jgi:hypothetical protein
MISLLKQLSIERILSGAKVYLASHPELGVPMGIFNTKDEPTYKDRVKSIKQYGKKGNPLSYKIALLLGIETPIPSYFQMETDSQKITRLEKEVEQLQRYIGNDAKKTKVSGSGIHAELWKTLDELNKERTPMSNMSVGDIQEISKIITDITRGTAVSAENMGKALDLLAYEDTLRVDLSKSIGLSNAQLLDQVELINEAATAGAKYGLRANELLAVFKAMTQEIGRNLYISPEVMDRTALLTKTLDGFDAAKFADAFDTAGMSLDDAIGGINDADGALTDIIQTGQELGVTMEQFLGDVTGNIKLINTYGFENGVEGLARMVARSQALGLEMSTVTGMAEKFLDPEGAIDFAARMQVIGGAVGDLADPFKLMYMATNDLEGLQDAIVETAAAAVTFDKEKNSFVISPESRRQLRDQAEAMGMSYQELADTAVKSARRAAVFSELEFVGDMSETDKELIASMAQIGEGGTAQIKIPGIEEMVDVANVTDDQMELLRKEGMTDTDIYKQQLTVAEKSEQALARIEAAARVQIRMMGGSSTDVDAMTASQMLADTLPTDNQISPEQQKKFEDRKVKIDALEKQETDNTISSADQVILDDLRKLQEKERKEVLNSFSGEFLNSVTDMFKNAVQLNDAIISPDGEIRKTKAGDFIVTGTQMDGGQGINALESALMGSHGGGVGGTLQVGGTITVQGEGESARVDARTFMDAFSKLPSGSKQDMYSQLNSV